MLEDVGQHHDGRAVEIVQCQTGETDAEMAAAADHFIYSVDSRSAFFEDDLQACVTIIALGYGGVVTGKLELMLPA